MSTTPIHDAVAQVSDKSPAIKHALQLIADTIEPAIVPPVGKAWAWDAAAAKIDPNSAAIVQAFVAQAGLPGYLNAGNAAVTSLTSDPGYTVQGGRFDVPVHIPAGTKAGCDDDGHLGITGPGGRSHDLYQGTFSGGVWSCHGGGSFDTGSYTEGLAASSNAASMPLAPGLLAPDDLLPGAPPHPLVFSVAPAFFGAATRYPGVGQTYPGSSLGALGMWFRFPPGLTFPGLPALETTICLFLQARGGFIRDGGDPLNVCALDCVNQGGNAAAWGAVGVTLPSKTASGYPYARLLGAIPWSKLQVLLPPAP